MSSGYKGNNNYRKYNPSGYKVSSVNKGYRRKKRNLKRIRNRIIIVTAGVLIVALVIGLFSAFLKNCVCASCNTEERVTETSTVDPKATQPTTVAPSGETTPAEPVETQLDFKTPNIKDNNASGAMKGGFFVWNNQAFESFPGTDKNTQSYANYVNKVKKDLSEDATVYAMLVPASTEMNLPQRLKNENGLETVSQADYIKKTYEKFKDGVIPVNCYNTLADHCSEDIYFNTDYRWTGLGGYYGYTSFAKAASQKVLSLSDCEEKVIKGFNGTYSTAKLPKEPIKYWDFNYDVTMDINSEDGVINATSCYFDSAQEHEDSGKHIVYMQGDYHSVLKSTSPEAKGKIAIVHGSFGRMAVPYFSYNYQEVHSLNSFAFGDDIADYCKENGITTVLFLDSVEGSMNK